MHTKNKILFHIHRIGSWSDIWKVGSTIFWGQKETNNFNRWYDTNILVYNFNDKTGTFSAKAALEKFLSLSSDHKQINCNQIVEFAYKVIDEQGIYTRETLFEEVRNNYFPQLPSRKTCIWVCEKEAIPYWWSKIQNDKKIFQLEVTGTLHKADQKHLTNDALKHNDIRTNAFNYWTGSDGSKPIEEELLFEGTIKVLKEWNNLEEFNKSSNEDG